MEKVVKNILKGEGNNESELDTGEAEFQIGEKISIRTVTFSWVGEVTRSTKNFVFLKSASWVADYGRFGAALETGVVKELEYIKRGEVRVGIGAIIDVQLWTHDLPLETKG